MSSKNLRIEYYEEIVRSLNNNVVAIWETNRGCPYKCSFCDWGSNTMSSIRRFDMDRVEAEIDWFGRVGVNIVMLADANFGILPRDLEIADLINATKDQQGFPKYFSYSTAKNNPDRTVAIAKKFFSSGLLAVNGHVLSIQHTHPEVLAATDRANISTEKQYEVTRELIESDIPIYAQLILGIPGDTYDLWKGCFADLMEWGIHTFYFVFPYQLLPNAPAANRDYMATWDIETIDRYVLLNHGARIPGPLDPVVDSKSRLIVQTKTYSRDDWVRMNAYTAYIKALHETSIAQLIAMYLRFTHNVPFGAFYGDLFENFFTQVEPSRGWFEAICETYRAYLENDEEILFMELPQLPDYAPHLLPNYWLIVQICYHFEPYFDALKTYLLQKYPMCTNLGSAIDYQKEMVVLPSYDREQGKTFVTDFDWATYFDKAREQIAYAPLDEPDATPSTTIKVQDTSWSEGTLTAPLDWDSEGHSKRWEKWINNIALGRSSRYKNNFQVLMSL